MSSDAAQIPISQVVAVDGNCPLSAAQIGRKAWGINRIRRLGLPVPPAMVITTAACRTYFASGNLLDEDVWLQVVAHMQLLELETARRFGGGSRPLLVSVRSGATQSMPGMMDTVLNLGMNAAVVQALASESGNVAHANATHARFLAQYRKVVHRDQGEEVPEDPWTQLRAAVCAVFDSWNAPRAKVYRAHHGLSDDAGTGVMVQAMVFGNLDSRSGTGVLFSRSPMTGDPPAWGEWVPQGQGEDVVAGEHNPLPLSKLCDSMPEVYAQLIQSASLLERDARDIQDIEFTVESGTLWLLQTRNAKRTARAAMRAAIAFAEEGLITREQALLRINSEQVRALEGLQLSPEAASRQPFLRGVAASPGIACGVVEVDPVAALKRSAAGESVVLARPTTSPDDLQSLIAARGLLTEQGGATCHAAVVSRELGRPCVVGCGPASVTALQGVWVTLDGATGRVWIGELAIRRKSTEADPDREKLVQWARPLVGIKVFEALHAPEHTLTIENSEAVGSRETWAGAVLRGRLFNTDEGIDAALAAGVNGVVVEDVLATLIYCLNRQKGKAAPGDDPAPARPVAQAAELPLLQLLALKGWATAATLGHALALPPEAAWKHYATLCDAGLCVREGSMIGLTSPGKAHLRNLLDAERKTVDASSAGALYREFAPLNKEVKGIVTAWQIRPDGSPNDHSDPGYDARVLQQLSRLHSRVEPLLERFAALLPRLGMYGERLLSAHARIASGEPSYVAKLTTDSYHTIWFELHKELKSLVGANPGDS